MKWKTSLCNYSSMKTKQWYRNSINNPKWYTKLEKLTDIFRCLNKLNLSIQSKDENILTSNDKINVFFKKNYSLNNEHRKKITINITINNRYSDPDLDILDL
jgi:hypothetical protein